MAEHVLAADLYARTGHIGLRVTPGGFATPIVDQRGIAYRVRVAGTDLVVEDGGRERLPRDRYPRCKPVTRPPNAPVRAAWRCRSPAYQAVWHLGRPAGVVVMRRPVWAEVGRA
ncbi:MAG: hypothetical protein WKF38_04835 [Candidatus Limnocylindrales bacterium]